MTIFFIADKVQLAHVYDLAAKYNDPVRLRQINVAFCLVRYTAPGVGCHRNTGPADIIVHHAHRRADVHLRYELFIFNGKPAIKFE